MNKINILFESNMGFKLNLIINRKETISKLLKSFFLKVGLSLSYSQYIIFLFNSCRLSLDDNRIIGEVFGNNATITVFDIQNVPGA